MPSVLPVVVLLAILGFVGGLLMVFAPSKRPAERTFGRRFPGVLVVLAALMGGFLMMARAGLGRIVSH